MKVCLVSPSTPTLPYCALLFHLSLTALTDFFTRSARVLCLRSVNSSSLHLRANMDDPLSFSTSQRFQAAHCSFYFTYMLAAEFLIKVYCCSVHSSNSLCEWEQRCRRIWTNFPLSFSRRKLDINIPFSTILIFYIDQTSADAEDLQVCIFLDLNNESTSRAKTTTFFSILSYKNPLWLTS